MQNGAYNDTHRKKGTSPLAAGVMGAAAGAAIGVGLAAILSDPQKRKKVEKKVQDIQKWGNKTLSELKDKTMEAEERIEEEVLTPAAEKTEKMQKELDEAAMQAQQKVK
jgi:hypothetical protein